MTTPPRPPLVLDLGEVLAQLGAAAKDGTGLSLRAWGTAAGTSYETARRAAAGDPAVAVGTVAKLLEAQGYRLVVLKNPA